MATITVTATVTDANGHSAQASASATIGTELDRRNALGAYGTYRPTPADVGVLPDVARTTVTSLATVAGGVYENKVLNGRWSTASNSGQTNAPIIMRNIDLTGATAAPAADDACLACWGANHIVVILEDCRISPAVLHYFRNCLSGHHFILRRCEITRGVDGVKIFNTNDPAGDAGVGIYGSWFHDQSYFAANPAGDAGSQTHNDPIQILGGSNITVQGNVVDGFLADGALNTHGTTQSNSCMMIKPDVGNISNVLIDRNWFNGGRVPINLAQDAGTGRTLGSGIVISNNVFGHDADLGPDYSILMPASASSVVAAGNVHTTGEACNVRRNG